MYCIYNDSIHNGQVSENSCMYATFGCLRVLAEEHEETNNLPSVTVRHIRLHQVQEPHWSALL